MNIVSLFDKYTIKFNEYFKNNLNPLDIESNIKIIGDNFTRDLFITFIQFMDLEFKKSSERKETYYVKDTKTRQLITSLGPISFQFTIYQDKNTKECYYFIRDILNLKPYQRITERAEYELINYAKCENMSQAARNALRDYEISRSTVSRKIKGLKGSIHENIERTSNQPDILYMEMDEIHANLQNGGNKICPCSIIHEGHKEDFVKRKELKNVYNFASSKLSYNDLWHVMYDYVDKKYDIDKFKAIFVSGDGASGIKEYKDVFPNAIYVLDKFHYKKALKYIFKKDSDLIQLADDYLRNDNIKDFKRLVKTQINAYPKQEKYMKEKRDYLIKNIEGIKNQRHELYQCPCAMEGHVSNRYARYITSSPYAFSKDGLENKLKLLVLNANHHDLTFNEFLNLKYSNDEYQQIINQSKNFKTNFKLTINHYEKENNLINTLPKFYNSADNDQIKNLFKERKDIYII